MTIRPGLAAGILWAAATAAAAAPLPTSDRLIIGRNGQTVLDQEIPEAAVENPLVFGAPITFPDDLLLTTHVVLVLEAPGETADPGVDVLTVPNPQDPSHPFVVSDAIARLGVPGTDNFRILFGSDGDPFLRPAFDILSQLSLQLTVIVETGQMQDVTAELGLAGTGYTVAFRSDVPAPVPLPGSLGLAITALATLGAKRRHVVSTAAVSA